MPSLIINSSPSQESSNDQVSSNDQELLKKLNDQQLLAAMMSVFYNPEQIPLFEYADLNFDQLPLAAQEMLNEYELVVAPNRNEELTREGLKAIFDRLLVVREAEMARLRRTTCNVHRAIASQLLALSSGDDSAKAILWDALIPEWRGHLDDHLGRIDALIWFELELKKGSQFEMLPQGYLRDRMEDVHRMFVFVVQCLQTTKQNMETESQVERVLSALESERPVAEVSEGHISDESSSDNSESSSESGTSEREENLFSDGDAPLFSSNESEGPVPRTIVSHGRRLIRRVLYR